MPMHNGFLMREGFKLDTVLKLVRLTALNPALVLPLVLLARLTRKGENAAILHPRTYRAVKTLLCVGLARWVNNWLSRRALNNWVTDKYDWSKEVVLVTGGAGGIGAHMVRFFAEQGVTVVAWDIQPLGFEPPANVHYFRCDLTSPRAIAACAAEVRARVGAPTVVINNAGVARGKTLLGATEHDVRFTFEVNALAHYWTARAFLPDMVARDHGALVTVASWASWVSVANMADYAASKAAAQAFHEAVAAELATRYGSPRVRTVLVNQGYTRTPLFEGYGDAKGDGEGAGILARFVLPPLAPETVAERVVRQVMRGESARIVLPEAGAVLAALDAMPAWVQVGLRKDGRGLMANFRGRQVVEDLDAFYAGRGEERGEESTVLVPEVGK